MACGWPWRACAPHCRVRAMLGARADGRLGLSRLPRLCKFCTRPLVRDSTSAQPTAAGCRHQPARRRENNPGSLKPSACATLPAAACAKLSDRQIVLCKTHTPGSNHGRRLLSKAKLRRQTAQWPPRPNSSGTAKARCASGGLPKAISRPGQPGQAPTTPVRCSLLPRRSCLRPARSLQASTPKLTVEKHFTRAEPGPGGGRCRWTRAEASRPCPRQPQRRRGREPRPRRARQRGRRPRAPQRRQRPPAPEGPAPPPAQAAAPPLLQAPAQARPPPAQLAAAAAAARQLPARAAAQAGLLPAAAAAAGRPPAPAPPPAQALASAWPQAATAAAAPSRSPSRRSRRRDPPGAHRARGGAPAATTRGTSGSEAKRRSKSVREANRRLYVIKLCKLCNKMMM
jgi:hypothetical protein